MNRTGLIFALLIAAVAGLLFGVYPGLDLRFSALFYNAVNKEFPLATSAPLAFFREAAMWIVTALVAPAAVALAAKLILPRRRLLMPGRAVVFLLVTIALAPGVATNVLLKDNWARWRPVDTPQFNGQQRFTAWWDPRGGCPKNCSFVGGESSGAFWTLAPASLAPPAWRPLAYGAAVAFAAAVGLTRISVGAHFLSDIIFSGIFTFLVIWLAHGLIYRWRRTRLTDAAVERWIERMFLPPHNAVRAFFSAASARLFRRGRP